MAFCSPSFAARSLGGVFPGTRAYTVLSSVSRCKASLNGFVSVGGNIESFGIHPARASPHLDSPGPVGHDDHVRQCDICRHEAAARLKGKRVHNHPGSLRIVLSYGRDLELAARWRLALCGLRTGRDAAPVTIPAIPFPRFRKLRGFPSDLGLYKNIAA